jgi:uncharacterized membrane protein
MLNYTVIQPNKELRVQARGQLRGVWKQAMLVVAIFSFSTWSFRGYDLWVLFTLWENRDWLSVLTMGELPYPWNIVDILLSVIDFIIGGAFFLGFAGYCLKRIRGQETSIKNIFDGFKRFLPSFLLMLFSGLFTLLWCLLLIIPGIIKGLGYSMAFFIMYDNPEIKPLEAIKRSSAMMMGYKWKLFKLLLSTFGQAIFGWLLILVVGMIFSTYKIAFICCMTGFFWLTVAYIWLSYANFYENLKNCQEKTPILECGGE